ncbi:MAG: hypothetical protein OWQ50_00505 [Acidianus infernus]|nr:hypothetical protein [Acidianus infernus]
MNFEGFFTKEEMEKTKEELDRDWRVGVTHFKFNDDRITIFVFGYVPSDEFEYNMDLVISQIENVQFPVFCFTFYEKFSGEVMHLPITKFWLNSLANNDEITFVFCDRIEEVKEKEAVCTKERVLHMKNLVKEKAKQMLDSFKEFDQNFVFREYIRTIKNPPPSCNPD